MSELCGALLHKCKSCKYKFKTGEKVCPECGRERETCSRRPRIGRSRCRLHGGNALVGVDAPGYRGRGWSKYLPQRLQDIYSQLEVTDPNLLLSHQDGIKLIHTRQQDLLRNADQTPSHELWEQTVKAYEELQQALASGQAARVKERKVKFETTLKRGYMDALSWREIVSLEENLRRLRESEAKRMKDAATIITEDKYRAIIGYIIHSINTRVKDADTRMAIIGDLQAIV